ncbi:MAG TPA: MarR family winged helix-turn-helix transcriptional regulator [Polyangiaceae bacterium]|nr:MarR family winged helix-turn-helix transcriptional regulator [Polyangiaceae bacterium]
MNLASLRAVRAWVRLDAAFQGFNRALQTEHGLSGTQLAILRILAESSSITLGSLRQQLTMHPATLGQAVEALARRRLCAVSPSSVDGRARVVKLTASGRTLLRRAPLAGPVRLRAIEVEPGRAERLAEAFDDAIEIFGLAPWAPAPKIPMQESST